MNGSKQGKIYIVATPIGNIKDISLRALDVIREIDYILSEDTRETNKILEKYHLKKATIPYTDQKHKNIIKKIEDDLLQGKNIALISDSGTPLISDPGFKLVSELKCKGFDILAIPGPNAAIAALSVSGLPTDSFLFLGFLPKGDSKREKLLKKYGNLKTSIVIYESSHRIKKLVEEIYHHLGDRYICVAKDITKKFEKITTEKTSTVLDLDIKEKGEYVVIIAKKGFKYHGK